MVQVMVDRVQEGKKVVRVHTGDPAVYGAIMEQIAILNKRDVTVDIIPGVSSVFASAAALGAELTIPELTQTVILTRAEGRTPVPDAEKLQRFSKTPLYGCFIFKCDLNEENRERIFRCWLEQRYTSWGCVQSNMA